MEGREKVEESDGSKREWRKEQKWDANEKVEKVRNEVGGKEVERRKKQRMECAKSYKHL